MSNLTPQQKIKSIYQMLFEMATGNLNFKIVPGTQNDGLNQLIIILNQLSERMRITFLHHEYVTPHYHYQNLQQLTIILDNQHRITSCTVDVENILNYKPKNLFGTKFDLIVAAHSKSVWEKIKQEAAADSQFHITVQLVLMTPKRELVPSFCTISRLLCTEDMIISSVTTILQDLISGISKNPALSAIKPKINDAETMKQLYDYILGHLETPLPTIKELAQIFKTNEFDLKHGFRKFFNTSIHHFYNEERLKQAHLMITQTDAPLKIIAVANGFTNYTSFYKAFKKRFGYAPVSLQRSALTPTPRH